MRRIFQHLRKPAVAMTAAAMTVLAVAFLAYGLSRLHPSGSATAFHPSPGATNTASSVPTAGAPSSRSAIQSTSPSGSGGSAAATASPSPSPIAGSAVVAWMMHYTPGGTGGGSPTNLDAYASFSGGDCPGLSDVAVRLGGPARTLYEAASAACMAALGGHPELWAQAEAELSSVSPDTPGFQCYDRDAYNMVGSLIAIHRLHPGYRITRGQPSTNRTSCPLITQIVPNHGPMQGGQQVQVHGVNLPPTLTVDFLGNNNASPVPSNGTEATVVTPASDTPGPVTVVVYPIIFVYEQSATYTYDATPPTTSPSASPSGSP